MTYIYIDESGDLGFGKKGSKYFIVSCVVIDNEKTRIKFERIPKKIRQRTLKKKMKKQAELKFSNSSIRVRKEFLEKASKLDIKIYSVIIKKELAKKQLRENLSILYNYLLKILFEKSLKKINQKQKLIIFLDKCMSPAQRENFENYIKTEFFYYFKKMPEVKINHELSHSIPGLQVVDFICGAYGYKYNTAKLKGDYDHYVKIIKNRVEVEKSDLFK